ncbi:MAG: YeeE/YedE family protein [Methylococcales bacterium]
MENFTPFSALAGGALIGISATLLLLFNGRIAGISGILNGAFFAAKNDRLWRLLFLLGLFLGALLFAIVAPDFNTPRQHYPLPLLAIGGFLVGFGAKLANGCISGHGVCGLANLSIRSLVATCTFMGAGMLTVYLVRHVLELVT